MTEKHKKHLKDNFEKMRLLKSGMSISFGCIWLLMNAFFVYIAIQPNALEEMLKLPIVVSMLFMELFFSWIVIAMALRSRWHRFDEQKELITISGTLEKGIIPVFQKAGVGKSTLAIFHLGGYIIEVPPQWQGSLFPSSRYHMLVYPQDNYYGVLSRLVNRERHHGWVTSIWTDDGSMDVEI